ASVGYTSGTSASSPASRYSVLSCKPKICLHAGKTTNNEAPTVTPTFRLKPALSIESLLLVSERVINDRLLGPGGRRGGRWLARLGAHRRLGLHARRRRGCRVRRRARSLDRPELHGVEGGRRQGGNRRSFGRRRGRFRKYDRRRHRFLS